MSIVVFLQSSVGFSKTCAEVYRGKARFYRYCSIFGIFDAPLEATTLGIAGDCLRGARQRTKVSSLLDSATALQGLDPRPEDRTRVKEFYDKYILNRFIETTLSLETVGIYLDRLNQYGVEFGICKKFGYLFGGDEKVGRQKIADFLFPKGAIDQTLPISGNKLENLRNLRNKLESENQTYLDKLPVENIRTY